MECKYQNAKIYCIKNNLDNNVYVGSTTKTLSQRMAKHRNAMKKHPNTGLYSKMNELGSDQFYIELIEEYPCDNLEQLRKREGKFIKKFGTLNKCIAGRTKKEHYTDNKDTVLAKVKAYQEANKDTIKAKQKEYREANRDQIRAQKKQYKEANKGKIAQRMKRYYEANKEAISEYKKQYQQTHKEAISARKKQHYEDNKNAVLAKVKEYHEKNKDTIRARQNEKHVCQCGCEYTRSNKARHERSKKHQTYLSSQSTTANNSDSESSDSD